LRGRPGNMRHFSASGVSGCDLYARSYDKDGSYTWRFVGAAFQQLNMNGVVQVGTIATGLQSSPGLHSFMLHLPTYNEVVTARIGTESGATIQKDSKPAYRQDAIVWYGTSILQGGVASRPGNIFTHKIARRLNRTIFNFGFSGNGRMELSVAKHLATIPNVSLIIIDCNWNMNGATINQSTIPLVQYFRANGHANTPIVLVEGTPAGGEWVMPSLAHEEDAKRVALRNSLTQLIAEGDHNLHYVNSSSLFAPYHSHENPTVAGTHPTDLGMELISNFYTRFIPTISP